MANTLGLFINACPVCGGTLRPDSNDLLCMSCGSYRYQDLYTTPFTHTTAEGHEWPGYNQEPSSHYAYLEPWL